MVASDGSGLVAFFGAGADFADAPTGFGRGLSGTNGEVGGAGEDITGYFLLVMLFSGGRAGAVLLEASIRARFAFRNH